MLNKWVFGTILCVVSGLFAETVVEENDFSTSIGHWKFQKWADPNMASYTESITTDGWARVNAGPNGADFWTTISACALYYKPDTTIASWTFVTCFRQDNLGSKPSSEQQIPSVFQATLPSLHLLMQFLNGQGLMSRGTQPAMLSLISDSRR